MKSVKTYENYLGKKAVGFVKNSTDRNKQHYDRAVSYVTGAIESGEIEGTQEEVVEILKNMGGMRVPFTDKKMDNKFADKGFDHVINDFAKNILADALASQPEEFVQDEDEYEYESKTFNMKHVKKFEDVYSFMDGGGGEDDYLETAEYFIEVYYNGQTGQLRTMLQLFRSQNRMDELLFAIEEMSDGEDGRQGKTDLKNWIIKN